MKLPEFKLTDNRTWYMQVASGITKTLYGLVACVAYGFVAGMLLLALLMVVALIENYGVILLVEYLGKAVLAIAGFLGVVMALVFLYLWATDQLD